MTEQQYYLDSYWAESFSLICKNWTFYSLEGSWGSALIRDYLSYWEIPSPLLHTFSSPEWLSKVWRQWRGAGSEGFPTTSQTAITKLHKTQAITYHIFCLFFISSPCFGPWKLHYIKIETGLTGACKQVRWSNSSSPVLSGLWWKLQFCDHAIFFLLL